LWERRVEIKVNGESVRHATSAGSIGTAAISVSGRHRPTAKFSCDLLGALPESHVEVKFYQRIVATDFMEQAKEDAEEGQIPIVIMKQNGGEWMCMIRMQDSVAFAKRLADNFDGVITR